jgi:hypothetical protein
LALCVVLSVDACQGAGAAAAKRKPDELGAEIGQAYLKMMDEVGAAVATSTDPATIHPLIDQLKTKYVDTFVALGRQREALAPNDREACDSTSMSQMRQLNEETLQAIDAAATACKASDPELAKHFAELERITRYANFDQLRTQLPDEAARLGIK